MKRIILFTIITSFLLFLLEINHTGFVNASSFVKTEKVCQITGTTPLINGVFGTDLGIMIQGDNKLYHFFGDTNLEKAEPGSSISNILAYSEKQAGGCLDLNFVTIRNLYPNVADFYAKESDWQAYEEEQILREIDQNIFRGYQFHFDWAKNQDLNTLINELNRKFQSIVDYYLNSSRDKLADYYARTALRLNSTGVAFRDNNDPATYPRDYLSYQTHYDWAFSNTTSKEMVLGEITARTNKIFNDIEANRVKQAIPSKIFSGEITLIPTGAIYYEKKLFVYFMSINNWGAPGIWTSNFGGLAVSTDDGIIFRRIDEMFAGTSNFVQMNPVSISFGYLYLLGTSSGRFGQAKLARVQISKIESKNAYEYCHLKSPTQCSWTNSQNSASIIVPGSFGENSVVYNSYLKTWLLIYLNPFAPEKIEFRTAPNLWGPWSEAKTLLECTNEFASCYGGFTNPTLIENNGKTIFWTLSLYSQYNVFLMKTDLNPVDLTGDNIVDILDLRKLLTDLSTTHGTILFDYNKLVENFGR